MVRRIGKILFFGLSILTSTGCNLVAEESSVKRNPIDLPYTEELQTALDQVFQEEPRPHDFGISAAVIVPGYNSWTGTTGNSHPGEPITKNMLFNMGSIAKSFEAALTLKLVEEGALNLDQPISTWIPKHNNVDSNITVRQLLNHTSGVFNVFEHPDFPWLDPDVDYRKNWQIEEVLNRFVKEPYAPPGYAQHYSSTNYLLLTAILNQVMKDSTVSEEVKRRFFSPLSLNNSFMSMGVLPPPNFTVAHPWVDLNRDRRLEDFSGNPQTWISTLTHPVLYSTPEDMARWMLALLHERRVLSEPSIHEMLTFPETPLIDPEGNRYGLGIVEYSKIDETRVIGHAGSSLGFSAAAFYLPEYKLAVAWSINTGESPPDQAQKIMGRTWSNLSKVLLKYAKPKP